MAPVHKTRSKSAQRAVRIAAKAKRTKDQKSLEKNVMKSLVATVMEKEHEVKQSKKHRLPKNYLTDLIKGFSNVIPTLTVKSLKNAVAYHKRRNISTNKNSNTEGEQRTNTIEETETCSNSDPSGKNSQPKQSKKGRPKHEFIRTNKILYSMAMNEVTQKSAQLKQKEGVLRNESFQNIVIEVRKKRHLPEEFEIKKNTVKRRIERK